MDKILEKKVPEGLCSNGIDRVVQSDKDIRYDKLLGLCNPVCIPWEKILYEDGMESDFIFFAACRHLYL